MVVTIRLAGGQFGDPESIMRLDEAVRGALKGEVDAITVDIKGLEEVTEEGWRALDNSQRRRPEKVELIGLGHHPGRPEHLRQRCAA